MKQGHSNLRYGYCVSDHHGTLAFFETSMICRRWPWQDGMGGSLSFKEKVGYYNAVQPMALQQNHQTFAAYLHHATGTLPTTASFPNPPQTILLAKCYKSTERHILSTPMCSTCSGSADEPLDLFVIDGVLSRRLRRGQMTLQLKTRPR